MNTGAKDFSLQGVFSETNGMDAQCYLWYIAQAAIYHSPNAFTVTNYDPYPGPSEAARMPRRKGVTGKILSCNQAKLASKIPSYGGKNEDKLA